MHLLVIVSFIWAFSFVLIKGNLLGVDASLVSFIRIGLSFLLFLPFLKTDNISFKTKLNLIFIGAIQFGVMYITYIASYQYLPGHMIAFLTTTTPLFITLFNDLFSRKIHPNFWFIAFLSVLGAVVIKYPNQQMKANLVGILLIQTSNITFAFGQISYKKVLAEHKNWNDRQIFALLYLGAFLITGLASILTTNFAKVSINFKQLLILIYLGLIASGVCFFWWNKGAKLVNEGTLAVMNNLKIPLAMIACLIILQEKTDYLRLILGSLFMGSALYINRKYKYAKVMKN